MQTRKQAFCRNCNEHTLHTREVERVEHVLHFLLTLLCCFMWAPVWALMTMTRRVYPWMCSVCGHEEGKISAREFKEERAKAGDRLERQRQEDLQRKVERQKRRGATQSERERLAPERKAERARLVAGVFAQLKGMVFKVEAPLAYLAGGDVFMLWFFRVLLFVAMAICGGIAMTTVYALLF